MPEEHKAKESRKLRTHMDKSSGKNVADNATGREVDRTKGSKVDYMTNYAAQTESDTEATYSKVTKVISASVTDKSVNVKENFDVTTERKSDLGKDKSTDIGESSNRGVSVGAGDEGSVDNVDSVGGANNADKNDEVNNKRRRKKPAEEHVDNGNKMYDGSRMRDDNEGFARRNEPKKREKNYYSTFLLIGVVALVALFVYILLSYGVFTDTPKTDVIAEVNNEKIPLETFRSVYSQLPLSMQTAENKELLLSQIINRTLVLQEASKKGITVSDSEMDLVLKRDYKANFQTDEDYENALIQAGVTEGDLLELIYYQLSEEKLIEHLFPNVTAERSEVEDFFDQNKEAIAGFYAAYLGKNVTTVDDIYEDIKEIVVLNKTIYLFSEYINELLSKSDITINTNLLDEIETYEEEPEDFLAELNISDTVISSEGTEGVEEDNGEIMIESDAEGSNEQLTNETTNGSEEYEANVSKIQINESETIECLIGEGYLEKDVLVLYPQESELYENITDLTNRTSEEFTYRLIEVKSEEFDRINACFNGLLSESVPQFICVADLESLTQEFSVETMESTLTSCKI